MDLIKAILATAPGLLIALGLGVGLLVFVIPIFIPSPDGWRSAERLILFTDWGLSIAAVVAGIGVLMLELQGNYVGSFSLRQRFLCSGLLFAFAGHRIYQKSSG